MSIIIREANPEDAEKHIEYIKAILDEPISFLEMSKGEFTHTIDEEKEFLQSCKASKNSKFIVAEEKGKIIGSLNCIGSERVKIKHNTVLGMSVKEEYRDKGIGSKLLEYAIDWAKSTGVVKRIELHVFGTNSRAIHLYKKYGFEIEGEKQKAIKINNEYINELIMALSIKK